MKKQKDIIREEFNSLTEECTNLDNPVCCERHDCLCSKISQKESIIEFIFKKLDQAYQQGFKAGAKDKVEEVRGELLKYDWGHYDPVSVLKGNT